MIIHKLLNKITPVAVYAYLVEAAKEMASQSTELAVTEKKSAADIRKQYDELVSLGLGGTQNAKVLKARLDEVDAHNESILKAEGLIHYIKRINKHFGGRSFLVSKEKFNDLCKRYGLSVGLLTDYNGVIPERNISEIAEAKKASSGFHLKPKSLLPDIHEDMRKAMLYVKKAELHDENGSYNDKLMNYLEEHSNILPVNVPSFYKAGEEVKAYTTYIDIDFGPARWPYLTRVIGEIIEDDTFFIACPKKYLNNAEVEISRTTVDPVVFQYCPYGVLVHSVWGDEAEDKVLREYMELNKLI